MKKTFYVTLVFAVMLVSSCKKDAFKSIAVASLTVTNTVTNGKPVKLGSQATIIANNNSSQMAVNLGGFDLYLWPVGDSLHPYYSYEKFNPEDRDVYSLFLGGVPTAVDGILIKEDIPYYTDSSGGIRFINLSPNSPPLNISLLTTPTVNEISNLGYKQYTEFKSYPALASTVPYSFQIKNASTGMVLFTYPFNSSNPIPRFYNLTIVIRGLVGGAGTSSLGVIKVIHDR